MASSAAARRYARALFGLASDDNKVDETRGDLKQLADLLDTSSELSRVLLQPLFPAAQRLSVLNALCDKLDASSLLKRFYSMLIEKRRMIDFPAICEEFERLADEASGTTRALVRAANPLSEAQQERLQAALTNRVGRSVEMDVEVDADLLGGVVAQVGDLVLDGSLRTQLEKLRANLMKG